MKAPLIFILTLLLTACEGVTQSATPRSIEGGWINGEKDSFAILYEFDDNAFQTETWSQGELTSWTKGSYQTGETDDEGKIKLNLIKSEGNSDVSNQITLFFKEDSLFIKENNFAQPFNSIK